MKITSIDVIRLTNGHGPVKGNPWFPTVVRVNTDEGIGGIGEIGLAYSSAKEGGFGVCRDYADLIIGMDNRNIDDLKEKAPDLVTEQKIHQMMEYSTNGLYDYVPDPYYSGAEGFELVLDLLEDACRGLLARVISSSSQDN